MAKKSTTKAGMIKELISIEQDIANKPWSRKDKDEYTRFMMRAKASKLRRVVADRARALDRLRYK